MKSEAKTTKESSLRLIGSRLALARQYQGLTQAEVAKRLHMHRPSITLIESGGRRISADELVAFADLYAVDLVWLSGRGVQGCNPARDRLQLAAMKARGLNQSDLIDVIDLLFGIMRDQ